MINALSAPVEDRLLTCRSMAELAPAEKAEKAIFHVLMLIQGKDEYYDLMGLGTESFSLLTEAYSSLSGRDLVDVRRSLLRECNGIGGEEEAESREAFGDEILAAEQLLHRASYLSGTAIDYLTVIAKELVVPDWGANISLPQLVILHPEAGVTL